ncbi:hypothetical protein DSM106972_094820 [Dulcicalothrix desertica PCC 7102]|uniref:Uncharacterized protein n=1 Tax=Dulcicalothrix desertica PCC 7102 TaxID=232991 RepID=A0A3S5K2V0_9CYAN|nr:hypothetical protein [Dulcicalothrix desertica]RUS93945.1 hypothetical protein DSM106972_094820 [Dulcicalothrix desertica PCC 7102]TWH62711.1 hypothetical protein CAL7102_00227 [Dulcicalothrix desertica PCC 7102]
MASKSKGFKELVQEKKALQTKRQLAQKFMRKVEEGEYGDIDAEVIVEPEGYEKMSDVLLQFLKPYLNAGKTLKEYKSLVMLGIIAWNASIMPPEKQEEAVSIQLPKIVAKMPKNIRSDMTSVINELMERKQKHFNEIKRLILEYTVEQQGEGFNLSVVSSLIKNS